MNSIKTSYKKEKKLGSYFLIIFLPLFILLIMATITINISQHNTEIKQIKNQEKIEVNSKLKNINNEILHIINDLKVLSLSSQLEKYWGNYTDSTILKAVTNDFLNISSLQKTYDQVRLIDEFGMELIRINFDGEKSFVVPHNKLQNKKHRYYFTNAFILERGEVFVSPFDLNIEHGKIEKPLKPMIRIATPVFDKNGTKRGIVLFNYLGQNIIDQIIEQKQGLSSNRIMLTNSEGYWLKDTDARNEWGFMYNDKKDISFAKILPDEWEIISNKESSQFITEKGIFTFKTVYPLSKKEKLNIGSDVDFTTVKQNGNKYHWKIISYIPSEIIFAKYKQSAIHSILLLSILSVTLLIMAWKLAKAKVYQKKSQQALIESENSYRILFDFSPVPIWEEDFSETVKLITEAKMKGVVDFDIYCDNNPNFLARCLSSVKILNTNKASLKILGYNNKNEITDNLNKIFNKNSVKTFKNKIIAIANGEVYHSEISDLVHANGNNINTISQLQIFSKTNKAIFAFTDITKRIKLENDLKERELKLIEINKTKDKFFSIIAHDLKSPYTAMLGFSELLVNNFEKYNKAKLKMFISEIYNGVKTTYKLLENLLLWSQSQRGLIEFNPKKANLYKVIHNTVSPLKQLANNKEISIHLKIDTSMTIQADENMLSAILRNLVSNAIKFTPKNGTISINSTTYNNGNLFTKISVIDSGVGILPHEQLKLFNVAENISTPGTENEEGTGLGLILCKEFVKKHNGEIWVESEPGKGSEFCFTIKENNYVT